MNPISEIYNIDCMEYMRTVPDKFAKSGDKILDTHLGSGSSRIAAYKMGLDFY